MRVQASMVIRRPREAIFDCVTSRAFMQQWIAPLRTGNFVVSFEHQEREIRHDVHIPELRQVSEGALGVGTMFKQSNEMRSHPLEATIVVTRHERPTIFAVKGTSDIGTSETEWVFKPASEGTSVTLKFGWKARGWWIKLVAIIAFLVAKNSRTGSQQYMQRLKQYIEDQCEPY